jgi:radical SAM protein
MSKVQIESIVDLKEPHHLFDKRPILLFWETTMACPLRCIHCRANAIYHRSPNELNTNEAKKMLETVSTFDPKPPVIVFTGGDPLVRDDIFELIGYAKNLGMQCALSPAVSENINDDTIKKIKETGISSVSISLDGATPRTHDFIRQKEGVFNRTISIIKELINNGIKVQVNSVVMSLNFEEFPKIFHLVKNLNVDAWEVFFIIVTGRANKFLDLDARKFEALAQLIFDCSKYGLTVRTVEAPFIRRIYYERIAGIEFNDDLYNKLKDELIKLEGVPSNKTTIYPKGTLDGDGILFVAHDGSIYPGGFLPIRLGNVKKDDIIKVYRENELLNKIRRREFKGKCGSCIFKYVCGGSRARAYANSGDPLESDPACIYNFIS